MWPQSLFLQPGAPHGTQGKGIRNTDGTHSPLQIQTPASSGLPAAAGLTRSLGLGFLIWFLTWIVELFPLYED